MSSTITCGPSTYRHHYVFPSPCGVMAILAIDDTKGEGGFDLFLVDLEDWSKVDTLNDVYPTPYWQDRLELKVIQNIYKLLDEKAFIGEEAEIVQLFDRPGDITGDIPF